jgi:hypothetical protein
MQNFGIENRTKMKKYARNFGGKYLKADTI